MSLEKSNLIRNSQFYGWATIFFGFIGFFVWASYFEVDQGIPSSGYVVSETEKVGVISPATGLVTKLNKRPGESVKAGDVLIEFDVVSLDSSQRGASESIRGIKLANVSLKEAVNARKRQVDAIQAQYDAFVKLVDSGFASHNSLVTPRTQLSLAQGDLMELQSRIDQNESRLREFQERISSIDHEKKLRKILSPIDGKVMNSAIKSAGVNITTGMQIMEVSPDGNELMVDIRIPVEFATRIHSGMDVDVMFPTLPGNSTTRIKGKLDYLSADRIADQKSNQFFLEAKVSMLPDNRINGMGLRAGVPAAVMIKMGPRTLISYIVRPITERLDRGMQ